MTRLIRPYDFILDSANGWRTLDATATSSENGSVQLQPLAERHPALTDPHGTFGGVTLPRGVAIWGDQIFIADPSRHRILHWQPCCGPARPLETIGGLGVGPRQLNTPSGLAISHRNDLVVVDSGNRRLLLFTLPGLALRRILGPFRVPLARTASPPGSVLAARGRGAWTPGPLACGRPPGLRVAAGHAGTAGSPLRRCFARQFRAPARGGGLPGTDLPGRPGLAWDSDNGCVRQAAAGT